MQSVSSRIWTRIAVFISYGDNDYTTGTSTLPKSWINDYNFKELFLIQIYCSYILSSIPMESEYFLDRSICAIDVTPNGTTALG